MTKSSFFLNLIWQIDIKSFQVLQKLTSTSIKLFSQIEIKILLNATLFSILNNLFLSFFFNLIITSFSILNNLSLNQVFGVFFFSFLVFFFFFQIDDNKQI